MATKAAAPKPAKKKDANPEFDAAYTELRDILAKHTRKLNVVKDDANTYCIESKKPMYKDRPMMFGAVMKKSYVSFHLVPLYLMPELKKSLSPELMKRMQGKACFNFSKPEPELFKELVTLTETSLKAFEAWKEKDMKSVKCD
jgi:hypothetical protein